MSMSRVYVCGGGVVNGLQKAWAVGTTAWRVAGWRLALGSGAARVRGRRCRCYTTNSRGRRSGSRRVPLAGALWLWTPLSPS